MIAAMLIVFNKFNVSFLTHRGTSYEGVLEDAIKRLKSMCSNQFVAIAKELQDLDPYQYARAYSAGLQEFVEAYTYYDYLKCENSRMTWVDIQKQLTYAEEVPDQAEEQQETSVETENTEVEANVPAKDIHKDVVLKKYNCLVQPMEFMLGLADLSGEMMRRCVNSLGHGEIDTCFKICKDMQLLYAG